MCNLLRHCLIAALLCVASMSAVHAGAEQIIPVFTGGEDNASAGRVPADGLIDYLELLNRRDGGINGVRLRWEECETTFDDKLGVACFDHFADRDAAVLPLASGVPDALTELSRRRKLPIVVVGSGRSDAADGRAFPYAFPLPAHQLSQAAAQIGFIGDSEGGIDRLRGKRIAYLYLDMPSGRESLDLLQLLADRVGFELGRFAVRPPGTDLQASWEAIRLEEHDWVLLAGPGPMTPAALKAAAAAGFPANRIVGFALSGEEQDVRAAGEAAISYIAVALSPSGSRFAVLREIRKHVLIPSHGADSLPHYFGSTTYNRGVIQGIVIAEAIRIAHSRFGARTLDGEQLRWGLERLVLDDAHLARLDALELLQPMKFSCRDHEGGGAVKFQQWLGDRWSVITDWTRGDTTLVREMVEASARRYAETSDQPLRECE